MKVVREAWKHASEQNAALLAAGVAFYGFLSLFPAMIAGVLAYGLFTSPQTVEQQANRIADALPADAASLINGQLRTLTETGSGSLGAGLILAVVVALYGASGGVANLLTALRQIYGRGGGPSFLKAKVQAFGLTVAGIAVALVLLSLVAAAPAVLDALSIDGWLRAGIEFGRWVLVAAALATSVAVLFRTANQGDRRRSRLGVGVAVGMWIAVSVGFSVYVDNFGSYGKTYGALAGVAALLLWMWVGLYALLLGASVETVIENARGEQGGSDDSADHEGDGTHDD